MYNVVNKLQHYTDKTCLSVCLSVCPG